MTTPAHNYLEGNFGPVHAEITAVDPPVTGTISVYRQEVRAFSGLRLRDGRAEWYRNRWVRSPEVAAALGEPTPPSPYPDDVQLFAANTNVVNIAGKTMAIVEAVAPPMELTDELETVGPSNFSGTLEHPFSAHPKVDPATPGANFVGFVYDTSRSMSVLFGGQNSRTVWDWNGADLSWTNRSTPVSGPLQRQNPALAYDSTRSKLFGTLASAPGSDAFTASRTSERIARSVGVDQGML